MVKTRHNKAGYSQAAPPPRAGPSKSVLAVQQGGKPTESDSSDSSSSDDSLQAKITNQLTQREPTNDSTSDSEEEEVQFESAAGSAEYVLAMAGGKPLDPNYTHNTLEQAGIKSEAALELWMSNQTTATASTTTTATTPTSPTTTTIPKHNDTPRPAVAQTNTRVIVNPHAKRAPIAAPTMDPAARMVQLMDDSGGACELMDLEDEEQTTLNTVDRGKNTKEHSRNKALLENKFFDTLEKYGGSVLAEFLVFTPAKYTEYRTQDRAFYNIIGGNKTEYKRMLLDKSLCLCGVKWVVSKGERKGKPLQPNTFRNYIKQLFYVFRDKNITYDWEADFNSRGEFHGLMITMWEKTRKEDATFGGRPKEAQHFDDADNKVRDAIKRGTINLEDPHHLQLVILFIFGRYCGLRGSKEHVSMVWGDIHFGRYGLNGEVDEKLRGLKHAGAHVPWSKTHQLNFKNAAALRKDKGLLTFVEAVGDALDPVAILEKYCRHQHPEANQESKFYCKPASQKQRNQFLEKWPESDIRFLPGNKSPYNIGQNHMPTLFKEFARLCGAENWEKCTGHGWRKYLITVLVESKMSSIDIAAVVRHSSLNSQLHYAQATGKRAANRQMAIQATTGNPIQRKAAKRKEPPAPAPTPAAQGRMNNPHATLPRSVQNPSSFIENQFGNPDLKQPPLPPPQVEQQLAPAAVAHRENSPLPQLPPMQCEPPPQQPQTPTASRFPRFPLTPTFRNVHEEIEWRRQQMDWASQFAPPKEEECHQPPPREVRIREQSMDRSVSSHNSNVSRHSGSRGPSPVPTIGHRGINYPQQQQQNFQSSFQPAPQQQQYHQQQQNQQQRRMTYPPIGCGDPNLHQTRHGDDRARL